MPHAAHHAEHMRSIVATPIAHPRAPPPGTKQPVRWLRAKVHTVSPLNTGCSPSTTCPSRHSARRGCPGPLKVSSKWISHSRPFVVCRNVGLCFECRGSPQRLDANCSANAACCSSRHGRARWAAASPARARCGRCRLPAATRRHRQTAAQALNPRMDFHLHLV